MSKSSAPSPFNYTRRPLLEDYARHTLLERRHRLRELRGFGDRGQLHDISEALARLDEGNWGRCVSCDGPIAEARLRAAPEATLCTRCDSPALGL